MNFINCEYHTIFLIEGDGNCLFASIAYAIYGVTSKENWCDYHVWTCTFGENNYTSATEYSDDMRRKETYGTICELKSASEGYG